MPPSTASRSAARTDPHPVIAYALHGNCYVNLTSSCTLRCRFCPKFNKTWDVQGYSLRLRRDPEVDEVLDVIGDASAFREIVFCGLGEPTLRLATLLQVARQLKQSGARIRINTDGLANHVYHRDVTPDFAGLIDALSISLNAQDSETYDKHCRPLLPGSYQAVLDFAKAARRHISDVTLTAIDGLENVDIQACRAIADRLGVDFRRRVLDEVG
jgi:TatD DNase family protein